MDNPHYVTPEEAAEKDCVMRPDEYWCKGPKCMAWRWGPSYKWNEDEDKPEVNYSTTHGYCGMVRS